MKKFSYILTVLTDYTYAKRCLRCNYPFTSKVLISFIGNGSRKSYKIFLCKNCVNHVRKILIELSKKERFYIIEI
jgi:hypothetical protein